MSVSKLNKKINLTCAERVPSLVCIYKYIYICVCEQINYMVSHLLPSGNIKSNEKMVPSNNSYKPNKK